MRRPADGKNNDGVERGAEPTWGLQFFPKSTPKWEFVSGSFSPVSQTNKATVNAHVVDRIIHDFVAIDWLRGDIGTV
jgi:hypothetical protein